MKQIIRLTKVEIRRLMMNKKTYILMCLNILALALGYNKYIRELIAPKLFSNFTSGSMNNIIFPFCLGCISGALIWGISIIFDANRNKKNMVTDMIKTYAREEDVSVARVLAYAFMACITYIASAAIYLPVSKGKMQYIFDLKMYLIYTLIALLPGIIMSILLSEGLYIISKNVSVSIIILFLLTAAQFPQIVSLNTFLRWNAPQFLETSDAYGSEGVVRFMIYSRIVLLMGFISFYALSRLFTRRFQFGPFRSFVISSKRPLRYLPVILSMGLMILMIVKEPFIDHSPVVGWEEEFGYSMDVDYQGEFSQKTVDVSFNTLLGTLKGKLEMDLIDAAGEELTFYINSGISIKNVTLNGKKLECVTDYDWDNKNNINLAKLKGTIKNPGMETGKLVIEYEGYPTISNSLFSREGYSMFDSIGKNYIKLGSDTLAPEFWGIGGIDEVFYINVPSDHIPTSGGYMMDKVKENDDGTVKWKVEGYGPEIVSSASETVKIDYEAMETTFNYGKKYSELVKENDMDQAAADVMNFCEEHFGQLKSAEDVDSIRIQQISNDFGGGGASYGWVYMDERFMAPESLNDEKAGANMRETFMHEIVHLYWGDLGCWLDSEDVWSAEGLTVYTTYRIVKEKYGELYAKQYYVDKWKEAVNYQNNNFYFRHPEYLEKLPESYRKNIMDSVSGINHYSRMPLMLLKAEEKLGGEEAMDEVLRELYEQGNGYGIADAPTTFQDFLDVSGLTEEDLSID